jgi:hypothetical protein
MQEEIETESTDGSAIRGRVYFRPRSIQQEQMDTNTICIPRRSAPRVEGGGLISKH